jgi:hypothetical protein
MKKHIILVTVVMLLIVILITTACLANNNNDPDPTPDPVPDPIPDPIPDPDPLPVPDPDPVYNDEFDSGNTVANLTNAGRVAFKGGKMYYCDNFTGIYVREGDVETKLSDKNGLYLNVYQNHLVFVEERFYNLCHIDLNTNQLTVLDVGKVDSLVMDKTMLYFLGRADFTIKSYDLETGTFKDVSPIQAMRLHMHEGMLFAQTYVNGSYRLMYVIKETGVGAEVIDLVQNTSAIAFYGDRIYYRAVVNIDGVQKYRMFSCTLDGADNKMVTANEPYNMNIADGVVYYSNNDADYKLYTINIDGTGNAKFTDEFKVEYVYSDDTVVYVKKMLSPEKLMQVK